MFFFFLISGLFLGWSLGANDAANVYGTAVGTRMVASLQDAAAQAVHIAEVIEPDAGLVAEADSRYAEYLRAEGMLRAFARGSDG